MTSAVRQLTERGIDYTPRFYSFVEHGGTARSAEELGVPEHEIVKTLVMQTDDRQVLIVLMHGDREVSTKRLARVLGVKHVEPCDAPTAQRHTGYQFGGTSPFGTRHPLPVFVERTILEMPVMHINGGKRGFLVSIAPADLARAVTVTPVDVAVPPIP